MMIARFHHSVFYGTLSSTGLMCSFASHAFVLQRKRSAREYFLFFFFQTGLLGSSGSQQLSSDNLATRSVRDAPKVKPSAFLNQCLYRVLRRGRHDRKKAGCLFKGAVKRGSFCHNDILEGWVASC